MTGFFSHNNMKNAILVFFCHYRKRWFCYFSFPISEYSAELECEFTEISCCKLKYNVPNWNTNFLLFCNTLGKKLAKLCKVLLNIKCQKSFRYQDEKVDKSENIFFPLSQHTKKMTLYSFTFKCTRVIFKFLTFNKRDSKWFHRT